MGRTQRNARERAATTTTRSYRTESGHNKLLGFEQTSTSASGTASTSVTHTYDAAGNLQTDGLHQYHYDSQGRLQSSQTGQGPDAPTTRYAHNALGQRVFKTEPLFAAASGKDGALDDEEADPGLLQTLVDFFTRLWNPAKSDAEHLGWAYLYDEDGSLLGEYGMGGAQSAGQSQYLYLPTSQGPIPMAAEIDNRLYAIHTDHLGTPRRLTQADGQAAWQWAYTPYGDEAPTLGAKRFTNETTNPTTGATNIAPVRFNLRCPGQYFDEESGLHYNYFRSYDPRTGRYTQTDPIGLDGGWNRFAYVGGNPLGLTDPTGLAAPALLLPVVIQVCRYALAETLAAMAGVGAATVIVEVTDCSQDKCKEEDDCGPLTRAQALRKAQEIAKIPKANREYIDFSEINSSSRGENCANLQASGATHAGYRCGWNHRHRIEDHPDGHPGPGELHDCPHIHVYDARGVTIAKIKYKRGS